MEGFKILRAAAADLQDILDLQYLAYQSEALLLGKQDIPPLQQSLTEVQQEFEQGVILKLIEPATGALIGSVRAQKQGNSVYVGKLMVHPAYQQQGLGNSLLHEIEENVVGARYELFTSSRSVQNLRLYERAGYRRFKEQQLGAGLTLVFLEKHTVKSSG